MISRDDVKKLAALARIQVGAEEEEKLAQDMGTILAYVEQIQKVSGESASSAETDTDRVHMPVRNVMRDDNHAHESGIHTDAILAEVPQKEGKYVKVKKIL